MPYRITRSAIRARARRVARGVAQQFERIAGSFRARSRTFEVRMEVKNAEGLTIGHVFRELAPLLARYTMQRLGERIVEALKVAVRPVSRTGSLEKSFESEVVSDKEGKVTTSEPHGMYILSGQAMESGIPSIHDIIMWMRTKYDLADVDQQMRVAHAIQRAIATKRGLGSTGRSTITSLPPRGERAYEYREVALTALERSVTTKRTLGEAFEEIIDAVD